MSDEVQTEDKEIRGMELSVLRDNLMTFASVRPNYIDDDEDSTAVRKLLDEVALSTLKKMKTLTSKVGK